MSQRRSRLKLYHHIGSTVVTGQTFGVVLSLFSPLFGVSESDHLGHDAVLLLGTAIGCLLGWMLGAFINRANDRLAYWLSLVSILVTIVVLFLAAFLYMLGLLPQARVLALGALLSGIGLKLLGLVLIPIAQNIPKGIGNAIGIGIVTYVFKLLKGQRKERREDKLREENGTP